MYTQHYIVGGKYLGQSPRSKVHVHEELQPPYSFAYFCPQCGDVWARCPVVKDSTQETQRYMVHALACEKHQQDRFLQPAGAMMLSWDEVYNAAMPLEVLRRELLIWLQDYPTKETV